MFKGDSESETPEEEEGEEEGDVGVFLPRSGAPQPGVLKRRLPPGQGRHIRAELGREPAETCTLSRPVCFISNPGPSCIPVTVCELIHPLLNTHAARCCLESPGLM